MIDNKDNKDKKRRYLLEGKVVSIDKKKYSYRIDPDVIAEIEAMSKGKHKQGVFSEQVLKAALHYVEVGLFVIPIEKNAKKPVKEFTSKVAVAESGNLNMNSYTHFSNRDPEKVNEWFG